MDTFFVEKFIEKITRGIESAHDRFYEIFSARGFLLELDRGSGKMRLNNESHREDGEFLEALQHIDYKRNYNKPQQDAIDEHDNKNSPQNRHRYFDSIDIPSFDINNSGYLTELFTHEIPIDLFRLNWERHRYGKFDEFKACNQIPAIQVYDLEPFIARLVKTVSSIGISTWSSCEGHWGEPAYIVFDGRYHRLWFQAVFNKFILKKLSLACTWDWLSWDERCIIRKPGGNLLELHLEIQAVARLLYDNRMLLRAIKKQGCFLLTNKHKDMHQKELLNTFEGYFEGAITQGL
ncbi:MAG: hypothetical protein IPI25_04250 [Candidatus Brocadia sp.]|nr:MAG: hypothetical protein IPI25_04250 [Candidatus Brocadia sp.]